MTNRDDDRGDAPRDPGDDDAAIEERAGAGAGAISGQAATRASQGLASGDTMGGTVDAARQDREAEGTSLDADETSGERRPSDDPRR